jgi:hypothetical protein
MSRDMKLGPPGPTLRILQVTATLELDVLKMTQGLPPLPQAAAPPPKEQDKSDKSDSDPLPVDALAGTPTLIDFLHTVPAPLVALLIRLAVPVSSLRHVLRIFSWQAHWVDSWLLLAAWWTTVLFANLALRLVSF